MTVMTICLNKVVGKSQLQYKTNKPKYQNQLKKTLKYMQKNIYGKLNKRKYLKKENLLSLKMSRNK